MNWLMMLYGYPHEALHVLALLLMGRRALKFERTHVIIPDDLSVRQFIFVAALPGLVFFVIFAWGLLAFLNGWSLIGALIAVMIGGFGTAGALGDLHLIITRLQACLLYTSRCV